MSGVRGQPTPIQIFTGLHAPCLPHFCLWNKYGMTMCLTLISIYTSFRRFFNRWQWLSCTLPECMRETWRDLLPNDFVTAPLAEKAAAVVALLTISSSSGNSTSSCSSSDIISSSILVGSYVNRGSNSKRIIRPSAVFIVTAAPETADCYGLHAYSFAKQIYFIKFT